MIPLGKVEKMKIMSFNSPEESTGDPVSTYDFLVNPSTYNENYTIQYNTEQAPGNSGTEAKYQAQPPGNWEFELLIDGTGVIKEAEALSIAMIGGVEALDVQAEVEKLKKATVSMQEGSHRNYYLKVMWGKRDIFKGSLESLDLTYKLFKPDGTPLRVVAKVRLKPWTSDTQRVAEEGKQSPDITHERMIMASDRFALMGYKIYKDSQYYIDVAGFNKLNSFRRIAIGTKIKFPPLK